MIDIDNLTTWDVYKMVLNAKPLSESKFQTNLAYTKQFDDMRFNDAVELVCDESWELPFVRRFEIVIDKCHYVGTGDWGDPIELFGGKEKFSKGKKIPGTICYGGSISGDNSTEDLWEYKTFDDALQSTLYEVQGWYNTWKDLVHEKIYQNNYNENKFLSVFEFDVYYGGTEYYVMQYIETYNPQSGEIHRNNIGNRLGEDYHYQYSKQDLDALLEDYTLVTENL